MPTTTEPTRDAFVAEAMMIRELHAYRAARDAAKNYGMDVSAEHDPPPFAAMSNRYEKLLDDWVSEDPDSLTGAIAYLELVAAIVDGERAASRGDRDALLPTERDLGYALQLLARVREWLNERDINDLVKEERGKRPDIATMIETLERRVDAELFARVSEFRRLENRANERNIDDDERGRRCDEARAARDRLTEVRPNTLAGVLAVLDLGSDLVDDPHWWPEEAIEGLRAILAAGGAA
jgi:hypothetical protein